MPRIKMGNKNKRDKYESMTPIERIENRVIHMGQKRLEPVVEKYVDRLTIIQFDSQFELTTFCLNWQ